MVVAARRWGAALAAAWAGGLLCIALLAAPAAFSSLPSADAGRVVGRLFAQEARTSLVLALLMIFIEQRRVRHGAEGARPSVMSGETLLLLGTLFCTVAGHFALQPMMAAARAGGGPLSFAALHVVSVGFFALKGLLVVALAWRHSRG